MGIQNSISERDLVDRLLEHVQRTGGTLHPLAAETIKRLGLSADPAAYRLRPTGEPPAPAAPKKMKNDLYLKLAGLVSQGILSRKDLEAAEPEDPTSLADALPALGMLKASERAKRSLDSQFAIGMDRLDPHAVVGEANRELMQDENDANTRKREEQLRAKRAIDEQSLPDVVNGLNPEAPGRRDPSRRGERAYYSPSKNSAIDKITDGIAKQMRPPGWQQKVITPMGADAHIAPTPGARDQAARSMTAFFKSQGLDRGEDRGAEPKPFAADGIAKADDSHPLRMRLPDSCRAGRIH